MFVKINKSAKLVGGRTYCELTSTDLPSSLTRFHPFTLAYLRLSTCVGLRYGLNIISFYELF